MPRVLVKDVVKAFDGSAALAGVNLEAPAGRLTAVLGPSGCGKSTLLRVIAGLERPDSGEVEIDGESLSSPARGVFIPVAQRNIGMVFQSYALWPHLTVFENIAFPLRLQKRPKEEIRQRVADVMALVRLPPLQKRFPAQISGGEQQRVALARALIYRPRLLLLDEPLANLDTRVREDVRTEIVQLQRRLGLTTLYVTHDQEEAMEISDSMVLMHQGKVVQQDAPHEVYRKPANRFAAEFLGASNVFPCEVRYEDSLAFLELGGGLCIPLTDTDHYRPGQRLVLCLRPEDVEMADVPSAAMPSDVWTGRVATVLIKGESVIYLVSTATAVWKVRELSLTPRSTDELVTLRVKPGRLKLYSDEAMDRDSPSAADRRQPVRKQNGGNQV
jgi:iron(III) transport system ATP-binding protein